MMAEREERPWDPCRLFTRQELAMGRQCPRRRPTPLPQWIWEPDGEPCAGKPTGPVRWIPPVVPWELCY